MVMMSRAVFSRTEDLAAEFEQARPFRHVVIDEFLDPALVAAAARSFPPVDSRIWLQYRSGRENLKQQSTDLSSVGPPLSSLLAWANSRWFVRWLERVTGICGLIADPEYSGGGLHQTRRGGHLSIHIDYNLHPRHDWRRALNAILFLNDEWQSGWGGALEFWDRSVRTRVRCVEPLMNRLVVFETNDISWHGHPEPLAAPPGITRKSIATYYYVPANEADLARRRSTQFQERPGEVFRKTFRDRIAEVAAMFRGR